MLVYARRGSLMFISRSHGLRGNAYFNLYNELMLVYTRRVSFIFIGSGFALLATKLSFIRKDFLPTTRKETDHLTTS